MKKGSTRESGTEPGNQEIDFDYEFAGGSVLRIGKNILTTSSVYSFEQEGESRLCAKIRVNQGRRERCFIGDRLVLEDHPDLEIVAVEGSEKEGETGRILMKVVGSHKEKS